MSTEEKNVSSAAEETEEIIEETEVPKGKKNKKADKELAALKESLAKAEEEITAQKDQYQRMLAEYANYKRRTEQEKEQIGLFTKAELLKGLLASLDNMERALDAPEGAEYKKGVDLTFRQFREALAAMGLTEIPAEGMPFDPEVHNAVMREDADGVENETVTQVFQKGYKLGDRVLRPAMVKVAN